MNFTNQAASILKAWIALEVLSSQGYRKPADLARMENLKCVWLKDGQLPWHEEVAVPKGYGAYYELILGSVDKGLAVEQILKVTDDCSFEERVDRKEMVPIASILLDSDGRPLLDSDYVAISSFAWGLHHAAKGHLEVLSQWRLDEELRKRDLIGIIRSMQGGERTPLEAREIVELYSQVIKLLHLEEFETIAPYFAILRIEYLRSRDPITPRLLNSFYLDDLVRALQLVESNSAPHLLKAYLKDSHEDEHENILEDKERLMHLLEPKLTPLGRWPSPGHFSLNLLQQAAVNATDASKLSGILGINGPPGTGKTTLLRDVVAAKVTERAAVLAEFDDPKTAFTKTREKVMEAGSKVAFYKLDERIKGYEMIVASANNRAVENISSEMPSLAAIAEDSEMRYLQEFAEEIFGDESWGLISAVLGRQGNLRDFKNKFWENFEYGFGRYLRSACGTFVPDFAYNAARRAKRFDEEDMPREKLQRDQDSAKSKNPRRPMRLTSPEEAKRSWQRVRRKFRDLSSQLNEIRMSRQELNDRLKNESEGGVDAAEKKKLHESITVPDAAFWEQEHAEIYKANLWWSSEEERAREEIFKVALEVQLAFVECAADMVRQNLWLFFDSLGTRTFGRPQKDSLMPELWSTLFLVVPVISTTFASISRMFRMIPPESLGYLLIDEAGQAAPQAAVGALMRAKRAIVVGDPMQLEPIVSLPESITARICDSFAVDPCYYSAPDALVQTLADAASPYKAEFLTQLGYRTVGMPLLVHRRCRSPMFDISNLICYANQMVQAREMGDIDAVSLPCLRGSSWIHHVGESTEDKWCKDEGDILVSMLAELIQHGSDLDVAVITPFAIVKRNLRNRILDAKVLEEVSFDLNPKTWVREHVGTLHTFQGRAAKVIFLVLGAQGSNHRGAREWAVRRPNLLNVAVTRAKDYFYVIGNRDLWSQTAMFALLKENLDSATVRV